MTREVRRALRIWSLVGIIILLAVTFVLLVRGAEVRRAVGEPESRVMPAAP